MSLKSVLSRDVLHPKDIPELDAAWATVADQLARLAHEFEAAGMTAPADGWWLLEFLEVTIHQLSQASAQQKPFAVFDPDLQRLWKPANNLPC